MAVLGINLSWLILVGSRHPIVWNLTKQNVDNGRWEKTFLHAIFPPWLLLQLVKNGPAEITWSENETIVKKARRKVRKGIETGTPNLEMTPTVSDYAAAFLKGRSRKRLERSVAPTLSQVDGMPDSYPVRIPQHRRMQVDSASPDVVVEANAAPSHGNMEIVALPMMQLFKSRTIIW